MNKPTNPLLHSFSLLASRSVLAEKMTNKIIAYSAFLDNRNWNFLKGKKKRDQKISTAACTHTSIPNEMTR